MKKDYNELKDLFIKNFNVNHLTIDLLDRLADVSKTDAENFILNKFYNELSSVELTSILGKNYIIDYYSGNTRLKTIILRQFKECSKELQETILKQLPRY